MMLIMLVVSRMAVIILYNMLSKKWLIAENALLWMAAGFNILRIGVEAAASDTSVSTLHVVLRAFPVFAAFAAMFARVIKKNSRRIQDMPQPRLPFYRFLDLKGYLVIAFMMTLGITLRHVGSIPDAFFAFFYTGLGSALFLSGLSSGVWLLISRNNIR